MQSILRFAVSIVLLSSALASYHSSAKLRRDGVLNLYPFPRVGRASKTSWQVPLNDFYLEYEPAQKRQLYAFPRVGRSELHSPDYQTVPVRSEQGGMWFGPRVGRSDPSLRESHRELQPHPARRADETGMWFGPRLGRSFKSDEDEITIQNEPNDHSEPEQMESIHEEREKRQV